MCDKEMSPDKLRTVWVRAPRCLQQLSVSYRTLDRLDNYGAHVFPPPSTPMSSSFSPAVSALSNIVYVDFIDGLTARDWKYLLTPNTPPVFAAQLTHLALRLHAKNRVAAAPLLPSLPVIYPKLSHVHIGVLAWRDNGRVADCPPWDAAVRAVRAEFDTAWCDNANEVVAWREDVQWRRAVGLPARLSLPGYA